MKKIKHSRFNKLRTEFLPEALEIIEQPTAPIGSVIIWLVFILLLSFIIWACVGKVDEVTIARGQILADKGTQQVQSAGTGVVTKVNVKEGDHVKKGDILFSMDKEIEKKSIDYSEGEMGLLELKIDIIDRMINGESVYSYNKEEYTKEQNEIIDAMISIEQSNRMAIEEGEIAVQTAKNNLDEAKQVTNSKNDKATYLEKRKDLQGEVKEYKSSLQIELDALEEKRQLAEQDVEKYQKLYDVGAKPRVELETKQNNLSDIEMQIKVKKVQLENEGIQLENDRIQKEGENDDVDYQIVENENDSKVSALAEIDKKKNYEVAINKLDELKVEQRGNLQKMKQDCLEELKKYDVQLTEQYSQYQNKDIVALYDGVIKNITVDKVGAVVTTTQIVAELIPDSNTLIIDAEVKNSDIANIELGQKVDVKVDTYNYQEYGKISGEVIYISPDAMENKMMEKVYCVKVMLDRDISSEIDVSQGMECTVEVKTGRRRIIAFFLEPLVDALENGLK